MTATKALRYGPQLLRCSRCGEADDFGTLVEIVFRLPAWRNVERKLICEPCMSKLAAWWACSRRGLCRFAAAGPLMAALDRPEEVRV